MGWKQVVLGAGLARGFGSPRTPLFDYDCASVQKRSSGIDWQQIHDEVTFAVEESQKGRAGFRICALGVYGREGRRVIWQ
ncbi:mok12 [Symbiodinium necroappetens]|uniref:Mok12 protein n=1 Tax=Symbiodinium necroappetens TaxID=1628268 RepID=A0A812L8R6_9DINO|nr:mok12 [Symbiodinium necroappetens]